MIPFRELTPKHRPKIKECKSYSSYRKKLRKDFNDRCGYCDDKSIGFKRFVIDHFVPQNPADFTHEIKPNYYYNLIYSCPYCNSFKSNIWPTNNPDLHNDGNKGFVKPTEDGYTQLFFRDNSGKIIPNEINVAKYIYETIKLDFPIHFLNWKFEKLIIQEKELDDFLLITNDLKLKEDIQIIKNARLEVMDEILSICNE